MSGKRLWGVEEDEEGDDDDDDDENEDDDECENEEHDDECKAQCVHNLGRRGIRTNQGSQKPNKFH